MNHDSFRRTIAVRAAIALLLAAVQSAVAAEPPAPPPPSVVVATIHAQDVTDDVDFIGSVEAIQSVDLRARVEGFLEAVAFREGGSIPSGAVLYRIEQAPYSAAVEQAKATLASDNAQLASADATLKDKQTSYDRQARLAADKFATAAALDDALAARDEASAAVLQARAQVALANTQLDIANLNLSYTTISAPIAGRIGKTAVTHGNLVNPSSGVLATIVQMSPIRVVFSIPERDYVTIKRFEAKRAGQPALNTDDLFRPKLTLPDGSAYGETGKIEFINNLINAATGTIAVRATFDNPQELLLPGQYVSVTVQTGQTAHLPVVPQVAVQRNASGPYVFVVGTGDRVEVRPVTLGEAIEAGFAVTTGLREGEQVVVDGVQKIRPGLVVHPTPAPTPGREG